MKQASGDQALSIFNFGEAEEPMQTAWNLYQLENTILYNINNII